MSAKAIVITRSLEDSAELAEAVRKAGFDPLIEPLLSIEYLDNPCPEISNDTSLIFTSASGIRAFSRKSEARGNPVYTVGVNTAEEARRHGFLQIESANGTAKELISLLLLKGATAKTPLLYVRGEDIASDIQDILAGKDIKIDEFIAYKAHLGDSLSLNLLKMIDSRQVEGITFLSSRVGEGFSALVEQYDRVSRMKAIQALCISEAVAHSVSSLPFKQRLVASQPDRYGMIELLGQISVIED